MCNPHISNMNFPPPASVLGFLAVLATSHTLAHAGPIGRLTTLVVNGAHRRQGIAHLLVTTVFERAERLGCEGLELTSGLRAEREAAHAFL